MTLIRYPRESEHRPGPPPCEGDTIRVIVTIEEEET